jgi:hypothetical protein
MFFVGTQLSVTYCSPKPQNPIYYSFYIILKDIQMEEDRIVMMSTKGYQSLVNSQDGKNLYWTTENEVELPIKVR